MKHFIKGQRVTTPHGLGTILNFERVVHVRLPVTYVDEYVAGDRIQVQLDDPDLWVHGVGNPHYSARDIQ